MEYFLGIDIGTSNTKAVIFDRAFHVAAKGNSSYALDQPRNGWAEQNPLEWKKAAKNAISQAMREGKIDASDFIGIGMSGQMHGLVMLDAENNVLRPAVLWCDQRSVAECEEMTERIGKNALIATTANPALPGFTASKILWVRKNEPAIYARCSHILLPKDYLRLLLTNRYDTEVSDASGMQLLDVPARQWSAEILERLEICPEWLPKLHESVAITGYVTAEAARYFGLAEGTPVVGGAGDNAAAAIGTGTIKAGRAFTTIGTSGVLLTHTDAPRIDKEGRVHTFCHAVPNAWITMGCTLSAGESLRWFLTKVLKGEISVSQAMREAEASPCGANRLLYFPYLMGERSPILDSYARGMFFGLSGIHTRGDVIRSILEGVSYSLKDCHAVFEHMGIAFSSMKVCGGGAGSKLWRSILANMYNCKVLADDYAENGALGAAILAAVGVGAYSSIDQACSCVGFADTMKQPNPRDVAYYQKGYGLYQKIYQDVKEDYRILSEMTS